MAMCSMDKKYWQDYYMRIHGVFYIPLAMRVTTKANDSVFHYLRKLAHQARHECATEKDNAIQR